MESEVDYEGSDVDSSGDEFYGGGDSPITAADDHDFIVNDADDFHSGGDQNYIVLSDDDIRRLMDDDISQVSSVLSVSKTEASALLRRYNWSVNKVHEEWFADESKVREAVGLEIETKAVEFSESKQVACGICFDDYTSDGILASACGHPFCGECWQGYISNSISEGSGCLNLRCPEPSCKVVVPQDMIDLLMCDDDKKKYYEFLFRSYVEENRKIKWCPAPGCCYAVEFDIGSDNCDVVCGCSNYFCWKCTEEAHRPIDCDMVAKWREKNNAESENTNWILAYTKPCPKCKKPIEKNAGCMRMTCREPCKYQFCWLCLNSWATHGYNPCNRYQPGNEDEKKKEMAKQSIEKYTHYYERWAANEKSRRKAVEDLQRMEEVNVKELSVLQSTPETQLKFIIEAWKQIVECRRVLKWTYAYGFYLPDEEHTKRQFFEYLQGQAEAGLERLHQCAEKELEIYLNVEEGNSQTFNDFRMKLTGLTSVTKNYFENLVRALENGLEDVDPQGAPGTMPSSSKSGAGSSKRRTSTKNATPHVRLVKARAEQLIALMRTRRARPPSSNKTINLNNVSAAGGRNVNSSNNLVINGDNPLRQPINLVEAGGRNLMGLTNARVPHSNNTRSLKNILVAGGRNVNSSNNLAVSGDPLGKSVNTPGTGGTNPMGLNNALTAKRSYAQFLQLAGASSTTGSSNLQLAGGSMGMNIGGGSVANLANANVAGTTGSSNLQLAWGPKLMNIGAASVTNLANAHVAGSSNLTTSVTAHVAGSSSRAGVWKKCRISNAQAPVMINVDDDDDLGEATSATGAPLTQNLTDGLEGWACDSCTFLNASSTTTCLMCSEDASGSWECEICTFVNNKHASTCQMCEHQR